MSTKYDQSYTVKPHVLLVAEPEGLAINLVEQFLANFCRVKIVSGKKSEWEELAKHLKENNNIDFSNEEHLQEHFDYAVFLSASIAKLNENKNTNYNDMEMTRLKPYFSVLHKDNPKTFAIFPFLNPGKIIEENNFIINN